MLDRLSSSIRSELDKNPRGDLIFQFEYFKQAPVFLQNHDLLQSCVQTLLLIYSPADFFYDRCTDSTLQ